MMLFLAGVASAGAWLWMIRRADRFEPEPLKALLYVGLAGGFASGLGASLGNNGMLWLLGIAPESVSEGLPALSGTLFSLFVGFNEEFWKAALTVVLIRRLREFDEPLDAIIYGMAVALGFAAFENIGYVGEGGVGVLLARTLTSMPLHVALAALWSTGLARARFGGSDRWFRSTWPFYAAASLLHAGYDLALLMEPSGARPLLLLTLACLVGSLFMATRLVRRLDRTSPFRPRTHCPSCDRVSPVNARYCAHCGTNLPGVPADLCPGCHSEVPRQALFCPACGFDQQRSVSEEVRLSPEPCAS
jgi:RsiW-degrading membrane proteinase PrsW (M82 family)